MITEDKVIDIFCVMDESCKNFVSECEKNLLLEDLFDRGIHLVHGLRANMKNRLMSMWDKIMLRKRCIIECINDLLKNKANIVHSRHRSIHNFIMNICAALTAYSFFENKPEVLPLNDTYPELAYSLTTHDVR